MPYTPRIGSGPCECEHGIHWRETAHRYGVEKPSLRPVRTPFGTFNICRDCRADGHLDAYLVKVGENVN